MARYRSIVSKRDRFEIFALITNAKNSGQTSNDTAAAGKLVFRR